MKKNKPGKRSKRFKQTASADLIEELNAVSATDFTGLIPANPHEDFEEDYEDVFPSGFPESNNTDFY